jgi:hypothetical protein
MMRLKRMGPFALAGALILGLLTAPAAPALSFKQIPATNWGHIYAGTEPTTTKPSPTRSKNLEVKSTFQVKYTIFQSGQRKKFRPLSMFGLQTLNLQLLSPLMLRGGVQVHGVC